MSSGKVARANRVFIADRLLLVGVGGIIGTSGSCLDGSRRNHTVGIASSSKGPISDLLASGETLFAFAKDTLRGDRLTGGAVVGRSLLLIFECRCECWARFQILEQAASAIIGRFLQRRNVPARHKVSVHAVTYRITVGQYEATLLALLEVLGTVDEFVE